MVVRELSVLDIPALLAMASQEAAFQVSEAERYFWSQKQLERWIRAGSDVLLGAELEGKLVGFVLTAHHRPTGKVIWENLFVSMEYRRQGIAEALTQEMRKRLKEKGATYLHLLVRAESESSIRFYEELGLTKGEKFVWFEEDL